jgi:hypothetical protein
MTRPNYKEEPRNSQAVLKPIVYRLVQHQQSGSPTQVTRNLFEGVLSLASTVSIACTMLLERSPKVHPGNSDP